jgi:hypothetical protein
MILKNTAVTLGAKVGAIVHPARLALAGSNVGPSFYHLLKVLGKEKCWGASTARSRCTTGFQPVSSAGHPCLANTNWQTSILPDQSGRMLELLYLRPSVS